MPTLPPIDWQAIIRVLAQTLLPLGIAELQRLEATVTSPLELEVIRAAIAILTAAEGPKPAVHTLTISGAPDKWWPMEHLPTVQVVGRRYGRGLTPTPRHRLCGAVPFLPTPAQLAAVPPKFLTLPSVMSVLGNDTYGDCVSAEEGASKMAYSIWGQVNAPPAITITTGEVVQWATRRGWRNGADLEPVIEAMEQQGMTATDGRTYADGAPLSVNFADDATLRAAIVQGPVKIGVAANQLEHAVNSTNGGNGWVLTGAGQDNREDHCVALWGFGTMGDLAAMMGFAVPPAIHSLPGYALYTWGTVGLIDRQSMLAITGEAWLRTPTTVGVTPPTPAPTPAPTPVPPAPPVPVPSGVTGSFTLDAGLFGRVTFGYQNGILVSAR